MLCCITLYHKYWSILLNCVLNVFVRLFFKRNLFASLFIFYMSLEHLLFIITLYAHIYFLYVFVKFLFSFIYLNLMYSFYDAILCITLSLVMFGRPHIKQKSLSSSQLHCKCFSAALISLVRDMPGR